MSSDPTPSGHPGHQHGDHTDPAGAGLVLGGVAAYTFLTRPTVHEMALAPRLELSRTGSKLSFGGRF